MPKKTTKRRQWYIDTLPIDDTPPPERGTPEYDEMIKFALHQLFAIYKANLNQENNESN